MDDSRSLDGIFVWELVCATGSNCVTRCESRVAAIQSMRLTEGEEVRSGSVLIRAMGEPGPVSNRLRPEQNESSPVFCFFAFFIGDTDGDPVLLRMTLNSASSAIGATFSPRLMHTFARAAHRRASPSTSPCSSPETCRRPRRGRSQRRDTASPSVRPPRATCCSHPQPRARHAAQADTPVLVAIPRSPPPRAPELHTAADVRREPVRGHLSAIRDP